MADGVTTQSATPATIPDATKIATDDAGAAGHVQIVKLAYSADGSATLVDADVDGLHVYLTNPGDISGGGGSGSKTAAAATCDTTADQLVAANASRVSLLIRNVGTVDIYLGLSGVTTSTGMLLSPGEWIADDSSTDAWYGITGSGTGAVRYIEVA